MVRILTVDDDSHIRELVSLCMQREGYEVLESPNAVDAFTILEKHRIDLLILDVMMPKMNGLEFCREFKSLMDLPVLMLTVQGETHQKVKGFHMGADDYLVKPFEPAELVVRVRALLRRYRIASSHSIRLGDVQINHLNYEVIAGSEKISFPPKEFELLFTLASYPGQIFTRNQLIEQIWGTDYEGVERTVDVHINRLRDRFENVTDAFRIETIRGLGYRLVYPR